MTNSSQNLFPGRMMLIGGGPLARTYFEPFLSRIIDECGGKDACLTILTAGSEEPQWANVDYWDILTAKGVTNLYAPLISERADAMNEDIAEQIAASDAIYIAGGSQYKFMKRLRNTPVHAAMENVLNKNGLIAGTSSGASVMGGPMILAGGTEDRHLSDDMIEIGTGFGWLGNNIAVDTHASSRGRIPRNIALLIQHPELLVITIDEDTGLLVNNDGQMEVIGNNAVYIMDGADAFSSHLSIKDVALHCLTAGAIFHLRNGKTTLPKQL